ncbi:hypothetical protein MKS88_004049 [Plasmodium brasilianum]|nr:hypothetical protein MKS88_004049 [Plasmodium brasilianum]SBT00326.1 hypothetical protein PMALA_075270 [Plasmodium malariae]
MFQNVYETKISRKSWNKKKYINNTLGVKVSRLLCIQKKYYQAGTKKRLNSKNSCFNDIKNCDPSDYVAMILNSYDPSVSNEKLVKVYEELKENSMKNEGYIPRAKEIAKFITTLLYYLGIKYKKKLNKKSSHPKQEKYERLFQIISSPKTKNLLRLTIPSLAETKYIFSYSPHLNPSLDEVIFFELLSQANSVYASHNKN